jgi:hypothetical protein
MPCSRIDRVCIIILSIVTCVQTLLKLFFPSESALFYRICGINSTNYIEDPRDPFSLDCMMRGSVRSSLAEIFHEESLQKGMEASSCVPSVVLL